MCVSKALKRDLMVVERGEDTIIQYIYIYRGRERERERERERVSASGRGKERKILISIIYHERQTWW